MLFKEVGEVGKPARSGQRAVAELFGEVGEPARSGQRVVAELFGEVCEPAQSGRRLAVEIAQLPYQIAEFVPE